MEVKIEYICYLSVKLTSYRRWYIDAYLLYFIFFKGDDGQIGNPGETGIDGEKVKTILVITYLPLWPLSETFITIWCILVYFMYYPCVSGKYWG